MVAYFFNEMCKMNKSLLNNKIVHTGMSIILHF